jgi:hypothetical protein
VALVVPASAVVSSLSLVQLGLTGSSRYSGSVSISGTAVLMGSTVTLAQ